MCVRIATLACVAAAACSCSAALGGAGAARASMFAAGGSAGADIGREPEWTAECASAAARAVETGDLFHGRRAVLDVTRRHAGDGKWPPSASQSEMETECMGCTAPCWHRTHAFANSHVCAKSLRHTRTHVMAAWVRQSDHRYRVD